MAEEKWYNLVGQVLIAALTAEVIGVEVLVKGLNASTSDLMREKK